VKVDLIISHNGAVQYPAVQEGIELSLERKGTPGKLTFTVMKTTALGAADPLNFQEGDPVKLTVDGEDVFYGFVFTKKRSKSGAIAVTAYDQLRYLKNKDTIIYENKTAAELIRMIANDFNLQCGQIEDTGHKIPYRVDDNSTLFDIIQNALDETLTARKKLYVLYDDAGKLTLRNIESMKLDLVLDADTLEDFDYKSTIDDATYDQVKVVHEDSESGKRSIYMAKDSSHINQWGVLQLTDSAEDKTNGKAKADALLALYNEKTRTLTASGVLGRTDVRAGSSIIVQLGLGDVNVSNYMVVESVKHTFNEQQHLMQLKLRGGSFVV
jgi:DNA replication protein DnaD